MAFFNFLENWVVLVANREKIILSVLKFFSMLISIYHI